MAKGKVTGNTAAKAASKVLRDGRTGKASKTAAGSALAQKPGKGASDHVAGTVRRCRDRSCQPGDHVSVKWPFLASIRGSSTDRG
jgi:hypothetical protein